MDYITEGAALVAAVTGLSGWGAWARSKWHGRREQTEAIEHRNWHGYIEPGSINEWPVRLLEHPDHPTGRVVLEVVDRDGAPDVNWAHNLRQHIEGDGLIARPPTEGEWEFLKALKKERGYGKGGHVVR